MELHELREQIDATDEQLLTLFQARMDLAAQVALYKKEHRLPILNKERERLILASLDHRCRPELLPYARRLYEQLLRLSRDYQRDILEDT